MFHSNSGLWLRPPSLTILTGKIWLLIVMARARIPSWIKYRAALFTPLLAILCIYFSLCCPGQDHRPCASQPAFTGCTYHCGCQGPAAEHFVGQGPWGNPRQADRLGLGSIQEPQRYKGGEQLIPLESELADWVLEAWNPAMAVSFRLLAAA